MVLSLLKHVTKGTEISKPFLDDKFVLVKYRYVYISNTKIFEMSVVDVDLFKTTKNVSSLKKSSTNTTNFSSDRILNFS